MSAGLHDRLSARIDAGEALARADIEALAASPDILTVGMLADQARRRVFGSRTTYVRVADCPHDGPLGESVPLEAGEVRLTGTPVSVDTALTAVRTAKAVAGTRPVSGFSLVELEALAGAASFPSVLRDLRDAGLEMVAEVPLDAIPSPEAGIEALEGAGYTRIRLTIGRAAGSDRLALFETARSLKARFPHIVAIDPLPHVMHALRPTTGYEDTKMVALARLAAPNVRTVQVDWLRYGPKLAQVALTFGADDLDHVSPDESAPDGPRRSAVADVRRNIEAAGFEPAERDGRFDLR